jgi:hypothetical protein
MISEDDTENKSEKIFAPFFGTSFLRQPISTTSLPVVFRDSKYRPVASEGQLSRPKEGLQRPP